jgi:hypothetical protein
MHSVSLAELETLARGHGTFIQSSIEAEDALGRPDVRWTQVAIRLPDDGTGALPLLQHVILNDDKSSTYKLALLRSLCRIADGAAGLAADCDDDFVSVPLGLVALTWIRLFQSLLAAGLPQSPSNFGYERLGFVKDAFRKLADVSHLDLRVGMAFSGDTGVALHQALKDAAETIAKMPANYMTYPNGGKAGPSAWRPCPSERPGSHLHWWEAAFTTASPMLAQRFWLEASSSLPSMSTAETSLSDLFDALCLQRMRLKHDQQVPEWSGEPYVA